MNRMNEQKQSYFKFMEMIPTQGYIGLALGSIGLSALFRVMGKKDASLFVGQWAPTFLLMSLTHKLLQPSQEQGSAEWSSAVNEAQNMVHGSRNQ